MIGAPLIERMHRLWGKYFLFRVFRFFQPRQLARLFFYLATVPTLLLSRGNTYERFTEIP